MTNTRRFIRQALTDPEMTNDDIRRGIDDLFESFKDENGVIHMNVERITADKIYVGRDYRADHDTP